MNHFHYFFKKALFFSCLVLVAGFAGSLQAADVTTANPVNSGDNAWLLASTALVLMMTAPGLILFYGGLVRTKNVLSTMMHSLILMAVVSMMWIVVGYSMAFAGGNSFFGN